MACFRIFIDDDNDGMATVHNERVGRIYGTPGRISVGLFSSALIGQPYGQPIQTV